MCERSVSSLWPLWKEKSIKKIKMFQNNSSQFTVIKWALLHDNPNEARKNKQKMKPKPEWKQNHPNMKCHGVSLSGSQLILLAPKQSELYRASNTTELVLQQSTVNMLLVKLRQGCHFISSILNSFHNFNDYSSVLFFLVIFRAA